MPHMLNVQAAPAAEAGAEAAAPAAGDWRGRQCCWGMVQIVLLIGAQKFNLLKWINCAGGGGHGRLEQSGQSSIKHQWRFHKYVSADFGIKGASISFSRGMGA